MQFAGWRDLVSPTCWRFVIVALAWPSKSINVPVEATERYRLVIQWRGRTIWRIRL